MKPRTQMTKRTTLMMVGTKAGVGPLVASQKPNLVRPV